MFGAAHIYAEKQPPLIGDEKRGFIRSPLASSPYELLVGLLRRRNGAVMAVLVVNLILTYGL